MPRLHSMSEYRWFTPGDAPPVGPRIEGVSDADEALLRRRSLRITEAVRQLVADGNQPQPGISADLYRRHLEEWVPAYGPTDERTVCRKVVTFMRGEQKETSIFDVHILNKNGIDKAETIAKIFRGALKDLEFLCDNEHAGREMAIVRTKLQEACFFAKRAMALDPVNQSEKSGG